MNEKEEVDKWCKDYYGFTVDEADEYIGYWMDKHYQLQQENQLLKDRIEKAIEYIVYNINFCNDLGYDTLLQDKIMEILKGDKNE